jgi:putative transposase
MLEGLYKNKYRIKSARLQGWDYGFDAYYFVTICTYERNHYFGNIIIDDYGYSYIKLSEIGIIVRQYWLNISKYHPYVVLDMFVVMPNHIHGIIQIQKNVPVETRYFASQMSKQTSISNVVKETPGMASLQDGKPNKFGSQSQNLSSIIRGYKSGVTMYVRENNIDFKWQARYYDRIIRDKNALNAVRRYMQINPQKWNNDRNNLQNIWM